MQIDDLENVKPVKDLPDVPDVDTPRRMMEKMYVESKELQYKLYRAKAGADLYLFNKYILGVVNGQNKVPLAPIHKDLCHVVQNNRNKKKLILFPRGHLKSTLITVGYSLFRIVENINTRILIINATWQVAVDFMTEIKNHLEKNETFINVFGDLGANPKEWAQDRITLHRTEQGIKGPTVWAAGVDTNLVGAHPDLIIMDDLVNREIAMSEENMRKVIMRYKDAIDLLEPGGQIIVIGTRWTDRDLYEWILDQSNNVVQNFDVMVKSAFETDFPLNEVFSKGEEGESLIRNHLWPEKFSFKELKSRYREKGPYEFSTQYMNNPVPDEDAVFRKDWFSYIQIADWRGKITNRYMAIDPALTTKKESDYTAIVIAEIDGYGYILPRHIENIKIPPDQLINLIFFLSENFHPRSIGVEVVAFQKILQYTLNEEMKRRRRNIPIIELRMQERSKEERIRALQPLYANGKILHSKEVKNTNILEEQLLRFPFGKHDDILDCFSMLLDMMVAPRVFTEDTGRSHKYLYGQRQLYR